MNIVFSSIPRFLISFSNFLIFCFSRISQNLKPIRATKIQKNGAVQKDNIFLPLPINIHFFPRGGAVFLNICGVVNTFRVGTETSPYSRLIALTGFMLLAFQAGKMVAKMQRALPIIKIATTSKA